MVEDIYTIKNKILDHIRKESGDLERVNVKELGEFVDMVKDLAEAEKSCWEASYYKAITESMGSASGYQGSTGRPGYSGTGRSGYNGGMRSGYQEGMGGDVLSMLDGEYHNLGPDERMAMKNKVLAILGIK